MSQQRLNDLAILPIENDFSKEIDYDKFIQEFLSYKARKVSFI